MEPEIPNEKRKSKSRARRSEGGGFIGGLMAIFMIIGIYLSLKYYTTPESEVKGSKTVEQKELQFEKEKQQAKENVKGDIDERLSKIKNEIENLNAYDVTTQSPQVKKIIEDLQSLQKLPKDQAKNLCQQFCSNFE